MKGFLVLVICMLMAGTNADDCECLNCAYCTQSGESDPNDPILQDLLTFTVDSLQDPGCRNGTTTSRMSCTQDATCIASWGKYLIRGKKGSVVVDCVERFCETLPADESLARFWDNGCRRMTNSPHAGHNEDKLNAPGLINFSFLHLDGCFDNRCNALNTESPTDLCPPSGRCEPWQKMAKGKKGKKAGK